MRITNDTTRHCFESSASKVSAVVGWGYRVSGWTHLKTPMPDRFPSPQNEFGWCVLTAQGVRFETADTLYLYSEGRLFEIELPSQRIRAVEDEAFFLHPQEERPWLGALLSAKVGNLKRRAAQERIGSLRCSLIEWQNAHFVERQWRFRLEGAWVTVRYEAFYKHKADGFVIFSGLLEPRVERVSRSVFDPPS